MIISKTPFRITLGGGGTDLPSYFTEYEGLVISVCINKFMYVIINEPFDNLIRIKYAQNETVSDVNLIEHNVAREALKSLDITQKIDIVSLADLPAGTGLGSSSCYSVGLLKALYTYKQKYISDYELAKKACDLEINKCQYPVGVQDQFMATYGGLKRLDIQQNSNVIVTPIKISKTSLKDLNDNLLMFYTNTERDANVILKEQSKNISNSQMVENMHYIKEIGEKIYTALREDNLTEIGLLFDQHWKYKKRMATSISNPKFDEIYEIAKKNGALGGKISGAGGGGFFLFYVESKQKQFIQTMKSLNLNQMDFRFEEKGTHIL